VPTSASKSNRHSPRYIAGLAAAAAAILVVGVLLKPREPQSEAPRALSQIETQRLTRMAQRRSLDAMTEHFSDVVRGLGDRVLQVGAGTGSGILWESSLLVTAGSGAPAPESTVVLTPGGHLLTTMRSVAGPELPLAAYELPDQPSGGADGIAEAGSLTRGEWVLAIWHQEGDLAFSPGHYLETRATTCGEFRVQEVLTGLPLPGEMAGGGLFDLDGGLAAVILPCGEKQTALTPASVSTLLSFGRSLEGQLLTLYGLRAVPLSDVARDHLGVEGGALVREIWLGHLAASDGLRPGDVIVGLGDHPVDGPGDLQPLLLPPELRPGLVQVQRGRRTLEMDLAGESAEESDGTDEVDDHGVGLAAASAGVLVGSVSPGSPGEASGLRPGDRIVRVDAREPRNATELRRALGRGRPVFIELERDQRRLGVLLER